MKTFADGLEVTESGRKAWPTFRPEAALARGLGSYYTAELSDYQEHFEQQVLKFSTYMLWLRSASRG